MLEEFETANEFGRGLVKSWASILDKNTQEQAEKISRVPVLEDHLALMPDAHFGYGPPVGSALKTRNAVMPYAVGVDIGCGMIAVQTSLHRRDLAGKEALIMKSIRDFIPSGVGKSHSEPSEEAEKFVAEHGMPPGLGNFSVLAAMRQKRHSFDTSLLKDELTSKVRTQFGTLGAGNHFVEVCEEYNIQPDGAARGTVWLVLHSGSRGVGNMLATAHSKLAREYVKSIYPVEDKDFAWFSRDTAGYDAYIADMLWGQEYAFANREAMMNRLVFSVEVRIGREIGEVKRINCHHNYAEEIEPGLWLTRKGAINAEAGRLGIIPGSMGAATYIVNGRGEPESYQTSPHGAGRIMGRKQAHRELDIEDFKGSMAGKTWLDRDAENLLDEAPAAYKPIETVIADSADLVVPVAKLSQFINYKGL